MFTYNKGEQGEAHLGSIESMMCTYVRTTVHGTAGVRDLATLIAVTAAC